MRVLVVEDDADLRTRMWKAFADGRHEVAVAADGEWTRRRVGSPQVIRRVAKQLQLPVYDVQIVGYPERMRAYNARLKASRSQRIMDKEDPS